MLVTAHLLTTQTALPLSIRARRTTSARGRDGLCSLIEVGSLDYPINRRSTQEIAGMVMEENAGLHQVFEESGPLSQAQLLQIVCNALQIATGGEPDRLNHLLEKLEKIVQLNMEQPQLHPPTEEGECSHEQRIQRAE